MRALFLIFFPQASILNHCWRGDTGALDEIPQIFMEAERQEGKEERGVIYYSRGPLVAFLCLLCCVVSFSFSHILQDYGK